MRKLLRAGFSNIRKMKIFWLGILALTGYGLLIMIGNYRISVKYDMQDSAAQFFSESLFQIATLVGVVASVFVSLFVGMEYSDGTVRNKLVAGQSRTKIYLANFVNCAVSGIIQAFSASAVIWICGLCLMGTPQIGASQFLWACALLMFLCVVYAAVYNFFSMIISSRSYASILNVLLSVVFLMIGVYLYSQLNIPEMIQSQSYITIGSDGNVVQPAGASELVPNPHYISGLQREIYQFLSEFLPGGQTIQLADFSLLTKALERPLVPCLYAAALTVAFNVAGIALFQRKDVK